MGHVADCGQGGDEVPVRDVLRFPACYLAPAVKDLIGGEVTVREF
jgi:hypothetical protein